MEASKVLRQGLTQMQLLQEKETGAKGKGNDHLDRTLTKIEESVRYQAQGARKPWLDEDGKVIWSTSRIKVAKFVFSQVFETIMGFIIIVNLYLIMREVDSDANCITTYGSLEETCPTRSSAIVYLRVANILLLTIYSLECVVRFYVERSGFFCNTWNMIDLITVLLGIVSALPLNTGPNLGLLRLSRLVRVMRAARVFISIPELYLLISGLYSSIKAIFFGSLMLFFVLVIWAVISVELLHPKVSAMKVGIEFPDPCDRCTESFQSVFDAGLTLFQQIVAGDSWGLVSIPLIKEFPEMAVILFMIMMTVSLGVMNLILAVIVERASEARANDQERKLKKKEQDRQKNMVELAMLCASMDADGSGALSLEEMLAGYDDDVGEFRKLMQLMDIQRDDITSIFEVLDADSSGEVSYLEFCQHLGSFFERDPNVMHALVKYSIMELRKMVRSEVVEILEKNSKMLWEQRKILWEQRKMMEVFRRESRGNAQKDDDAYFRSSSWASTNGTLGEVPIGSASPLSQEPTRALPQPLGNFQSIQDELRILLAKAEDVSMAALPDPMAPDFQPNKADERRSRRVDFARKSKSRTKSFESDNPNARATMSPEQLRIERDRQALCESFQDRMREAERLQEQFRQIIDRLSTIGLEGDAGEDGKTKVVSERV